VSKLSIALGLLLFFCGTLLFFIKQNWLIIHWVPGYSGSRATAKIISKKMPLKKKITLYYWKDGVRKREQSSFISLLNKTDDLKLLVGDWLLFLYEERVLSKRIKIETVALSSSKQEAYLSFNQSLCAREWSIRKKWQLINGLCQTIAHAHVGVRSLFFLTNNEAMSDEHLDFSRSWPV